MRIPGLMMHAWNRRRSGRGYSGASRCMTRRGRPDCIDHPASGAIGRPPGAEGGAAETVKEGLLNP
jgi:hypothetical protein